jgi:hypothetical protein
MAATLVSGTVGAKTPKKKEKEKSPNNGTHRSLKTCKLVSLGQQGIG